MKKLASIIVLALGLLALGAADPIKIAPSFVGANPVYVSNGQLTSATWQAGIKIAPSFVGANPVYDSNGQLSAASWQAGFTQWALVDGKKLTAQTNVNWDGMREDFTVVVDGMKITPRQATEAIGAISAYILAEPPSP